MAIIIGYDSKIIMKFFIGTTNSDKVREIVSILNAVGCDFEITSPVDPEETEADFDGNAILKARAYAGYVGGVTISEDSGLVIPSLGGLPGPWSARFSDCEIDKKDLRVVKCEKSDITRQERDVKNNQLVLELMRSRIECSCVRSMMASQ
mgnify:FL=1